MGFKLLFHVALLVLLQITANIFVVAEEGAFVALRGSQMETERMLEEEILQAGSSTASPTTETSTEPPQPEDVVIIDESEDDIVFDDDLVDGNSTDGNSTDGNSTIVDDDEEEDDDEEDDDEELGPLGKVNPLNNGGNVLVQIKYLIQSLYRKSSINRDEEAATQTTAGPDSPTRSIFLARHDSIARTVPNDLLVRK